MTDDAADWMHTTLVTVAMTPYEWACVVAALRLAPSPQWKRIENVIGNAVLDSTGEER